MRAQSGFTYLALLFAVALIGTSLGIAGQVWHLQVQRDKEAELLWVGNQYRQAIELYWRASGARGGGGGAPVGVGVPAAVTVQGGNALAGGNSLPGGGDLAALAGAAGAPAPAPVGGSLQGTPPGATPVAGVPGGNGRFPASLQDLTSDPRYQQVRRYLRRLYPDPVTGKADWVPILAPGGGIMGVRSASEARPIKQDNFAARDIAFTGQTRYADWAFVFVPPVNFRRPASTSGYVVPPGGVNNIAPGVAMPPSAAPATFP